MSGILTAPRGRAWLRLMVWAGAWVAAAAALAAIVPHPLLLWNETPSEPLGLYVRAATPLRVGVIIAFWTPPAAFPYADARMGYLHRITILKGIIAAQNDHVCTAGGELKVNYQPLAKVMARDERGVALPVWRDCRTLGHGEYFVFSGRIPNSFDSRYYGPIRRGAIVGVFTPLWVQADAPGRA